MKSPKTSQKHMIIIIERKFICFLIILNSWIFDTISQREPGTTGTTFQNYTVSIPELQQFHGVRRFELERSCCFSALLLDEERGRLFVGAKNFLLSLSLDNIAKQEHKVGQSWWRQESYFPIIAKLIESMLFQRDFFNIWVPSSLISEERKQKWLFSNR